MRSPNCARSSCQFWNANSRRRLSVTPNERAWSSRCSTNSFGLGPLETLLADRAISDILVNRFDQVYIERDGRLEAHGRHVQDDRHLLQIIERIVSAVGRRIDESSPMVDARLKDGSRVNAIIPPLALERPALSIRRFRTDRLGANDLVTRDSLTAPMLEFLKVAAVAVA